MPKDWKNQPRTVEEFCTCEWVAAEYAPHINTVKVTMDGREWKLVQVDDNCPLHGNNPMDDLPEGV